MANIEKLQETLSELIKSSTEEELETLLLEVLNPEMVKKMASQYDTLEWHRQNVLGLTQDEMAERLNELYQKKEKMAIPPRQNTISRLEKGVRFPRLLPSEQKILAQAYELEFDEFCRMVDKVFLDKRKNIA